MLRRSRRTRGYPPWSPTWTESPATSSAVEKASGGIGVPRYGGSRSRLKVWAAPQDHVESGGGVGRTRGALVAVNGAGTWQRPNRPESGKTASPRRLLTVGVPWGWPEVI